MQSTAPNITLNEASTFSWLTEFTYETDAPVQVKELSNKTAEKYYRLYYVHYEVAGTKIGAGLVIIYVKSKPINDQETKIDFNARAKYVYAKSDSFDIKKKKADMNGHSVLNSKTDKLSIRIPWAEIFKNM